ncbi:MAG: protein TolR [Gammaproteobacteria bacterium]|nr:MAG: protein TolR [Gammaproteobacteria bacterium]
MAYVGIKRRKRMAEINVVPYIDVTLVLLVIFMVTAPLFHQGVEVDLPSAPAKPLEKIDENQEPLIISVDRAGKVFVNKSDTPREPVADEFFRNQIEEILSKEASPVYVRGDNGVDYGRVVTVMVMLQQAGAENVGLITDPTVSDSTMSDLTVKELDPL